MFLNEFKEGDFVVVPGNRDFSVYTIVGKAPISKEHIWEYTKSPEAKEVLKYIDGRYYNKDGKECELGSFWLVKPYQLNIERSSFASNNLQRRLKFQMTNIDLTDLATDIEEAIKAKKSGEKINLKDEIEDGASSIILDKLLSKINSSAFEKVGFVLNISELYILLYISILEDIF